MSSGGPRARFTGDGGTLLGTFMIYGMGMAFAAIVCFAGLPGIGMAIDVAAGTGGILTIILGFVGFVVGLAVVVIGSALRANKMYEFYFSNLVLDGQQLRYTGTPAGLRKAQGWNGLLTILTLGIYAPWAMVAMRKWAYEQIEIGGQRGRLTFHGDGGTLLGTNMIGRMLMMCTLGVYFPWYMNDIAAFIWENTRLDGRPFAFRKDAASFLGTHIINSMLTSCTAGIYFPWALCKMHTWEAEHVG